MIILRFTRYTLDYDPMNRPRHPQTRICHYPARPQHRRSLNYQTWTWKKTKELQRLEQYQRMLDIRNFFADMLKNYKEITVVSIEKYFFTNFNKGNAEFVFAVRGIILSMLATELGKEIREYTPIQLKKNVTGNSKASKETMQKVITKILNSKICQNTTMLPMPSVLLC